MSLVLGKDLVLYVFDGVNFVPIACARECEFTTTTEVSGKSTIGSGLFREFKPIVSSGSLTASGVVSFDNNYPVSSLRTLQLNLSEVLFQFKVVDQGGEGIVYSGAMIMTTITESGPYNDIGTYSVQAVTSGAIAITSTVGNPGIIYYNTQDNFDDPIDFTQFIVGNPDNDITIDYGHKDSALYYWMAHSVGSLQKTNWEDENEFGNNGTIGGDTDLYAVRIIEINGFEYLLYITRYVTFFNGYNAVVKYYRIPGGCMPPTNFAITSIVDNTDTGNITEVATVVVLTADVTPPDTILTSAGVTTANFEFGSIITSSFTSSLGGTRLTYSGGGAISAEINWTIQGVRHSLISPFLLQLYKNGVAQTGSSLTINSNLDTFDVPYVWNNSANIILNNGDYIEFNANATLSGSDTDYLLTQTLGNLSIATGDAVNQEFQITGAPQVGGVFTGSIYSTSLEYDISVLQTNAEIAAGIVAIINAASIAVPIGNQPPSIVSASVDPLNDNMFIVSSGTGDNASFSYLPASLATITFNFDEPVDPGLTYTIRIIVSGATFTQVGSVAPRQIGVRRGYDYLFAIRTDCENGSSDWTSDLAVFIP